MGVKVEPPFCWPGAAQSVPRERIEFSKGEERREEAPPPFSGGRCLERGRGRELKILTDIQELSPRVQCDATNHRAVNRH